MWTDSSYTGGEEGDGDPQKYPRTHVYAVFYLFEGLEVTQVYAALSNYMYTPLSSKDISTDTSLGEYIRSGEVSSTANTRAELISENRLCSKYSTYCSCCRIHLH